MVDDAARGAVSPSQVRICHEGDVPAGWLRNQHPDSRHFDEFPEQSLASKTLEPFRETSVVTNALSQQ